MNDHITGNDAVKRYFQWQQALMNDETLRKLACKSEWDIRYTALVIASYHTEHSWVSADLLAKVIGCSLNTAKRHRAELIQLGWFTEVDRSRRNVTLAIALPDIRETHDKIRATHQDESLSGSLHEPRPHESSEQLGSLKAASEHYKSCGCQENQYGFIIKICGNHTCCKWDCDRPATKIVNGFDYSCDDCARAIC
jgi:hypothetical protein